MSAVARLPRSARLAAPARLRSTPGRLWLLGVAILVVAIAGAVVAAGATASRREAARTAATTDEHELALAAQLYGVLSDADATAASTYLTGGLEPPARRARYLADLHAAGRDAVALGRSAPASSPLARAAGALGAQIPVYSGLVETARTNNRHGYPIGAAYLRQASQLMRGALLPAAGRIYAREARALAGA